MFYHLLESSRCDDSNKWSNIGFGEEIGITEIEICTLSRALKMSFSQDDKLSKLRTMMRKFNMKQRQQIVNQKINGNAPLFTACFLGKVHFVNYFLEECSADIEMKGNQPYSALQKFWNKMKIFFYNF